MTEMLTGIDLVATQIRIAAGEPLGFSQSDVTFRGHAIEFRINAEDADARLPAAAPARSSATIAPGGPGVRMDSHLYAGYEVPPYYDSLLGKLIVWGPDRERPSRAAGPRSTRWSSTASSPTCPSTRRCCERALPGGTDDHEPARSRGELRLPRGRRPREPMTPALREAHAHLHAPSLIARAGRHDHPRLTADTTAALAGVARRPTGIVHTTREIESLIPHRWPFLLVDRIVEYDPAGERIVGLKGVTATEWFFQGHFPGLPVMPGVLQVEALAQTMAVYVSKQDGFGDRIGLFAGIDEVRFKRIVVPGDTLRLEVTMDKLGKRFGRGRGVASVDGEVACEGLLSFIIPPAGVLR